MKTVQAGLITLCLLHLISCASETKEEPYLFKNRFRIFGDIPYQSSKARIVDFQTLEPSGFFLITREKFPPTAWSWTFHGTFFNDNGTTESYVCRRLSSQTALGGFTESISCTQGNPEVD